MDLDLGSKPVVNVKIGTDVYEMSVPTVRQSVAFGEEIKKCEDDSDKTLAFVKFMTVLGMPEEIVEELSVNQMTKLSEGLMGATSVKK